MHPTFFRIGDFEIGTYGVMLALGFFFALSLAGRRAGRFGLTSDKVASLGFFCVVAGIIVARLTYLALNLGEFLARPAALLFSRSGYVFFGGLLGGILAAVIWSRMKKVSFWETADLAAPAIPLAHAFGRMGCFLNGCCFGRVTRLPWGVCFPRIPPPGEGPPVGGEAFLQHLHEGLVSADSTHSLSVHPTQLYSVIFNLALFSFLLWYTSRRRFSGELFFYYAISYSLFRFLLEMARADVVRVLGPVSSTQVLCLLVLAASPLLYRSLRRQSRVREPAEESKT
jgi:phosphatidylglycerol:prolipoprotein diacylglycerol transferase